MWLDDLALTTVIVHTIHGGPSYRGNKEAVYEDGILLRDVVNLDQGTVTDEGPSFIPRDQIHRIQILGDVPRGDAANG